MNLILTLTIIGFLLLFSGLFILASIPFSLHFGGDDIPALLISGLGTFLVGLLLFVTNKNDRGEELTKRNVYLIVSADLILASLFGFHSLHFRKSKCQIFIN